MQYDLSELKKLTNDDETFIIDMLQTYKRNVPPILKRMEEYLTQQKYEAVGREAHHLIPGTGLLGAQQLKEILVKIEETAKSGEGLENMPSLITESVRQTYELIACFDNLYPGKI
jgi:HPt (histidine-containing phosphotransfer) domain-containing protein